MGFDTVIRRSETLKPNLCGSECRVPLDRELPLQFVCKQACKIKPARQKGAEGSFSHHIMRGTCTLRVFGPLFGPFVAISAKSRISCLVIVGTK
jgi:hypothetical protein